ncbi:immunoglobulin-like domain-containing protein [Clostridium tarantellae]|uniref:DUF5011 domain-containing protein n=1 Tax=Clostridium tarantellae TaxID=39493 RepID=A0A6I1MJD9_9CLOT|nr:immunoglobulin-like domain-containing protein [Clostridium tarantellae]MPQ43054.1 DUF5011 domain-containing protein [Clostridium tarantellae]
MKKKKLIALVISAILGINQNIAIVLAEEKEEKKLKNNIIHVNGLAQYSNSNKFDITFDEGNKEFRVINQRDIVIQPYFKENKYFQIQIFNKLGIEKLNVNIVGVDKGNSDKLNILNGFKYEYGDIIKLWYAEPGRDSIDGNIIEAKEDYSDKIQNRDYIDNVVFEITENGLKSIYNEEPKIIGVENLKIRVNSSFNKLEGVLVTDDHDGDITNKLVITGEVNTEIAGNYPIEYKVMDKWGRETKITRMITVAEPSKLENNVIHIDNLGEEDIKDIFKIGFDDFKKEFKLYDEKDDFINISNKNEKSFYIKIIDRNRTEKLLINLNGIDKGTSEKLKLLRGFKYEYGDVIQLWSSNSNKQRIEGEIIEGRENYLDGIQGVEGFNKIENVEFEITEDGLKAKYNSSPQLKGLDDINIKVGDLFDKMKGVTALDLEDGDISKKIAVAGTVNNTIEGENILEYSVIDSLGNKALAKRKVIVSQRKALEKNIICTEGIGRVRHREKFKIGFNEDKKQIKVYDQSWSHLHNYYVKKDYFKVSILDKNLKEKLTITLDGLSRGTSAKLNPLKEFNYDYGDIIKLWHAEPSKQLILGNIINAKEDYSHGIRGVAGFKNINDVAFEITESGLKAIYNTPPEIKGAEDIEIKIGDKFDVNEGIAAVDDRDGDITNKLVISGDVDINNTGVYTVDYSVMNSWGKETVIKRRIIIRQNKKPILSGLDNLVLRIGDEFNPLKGVVAKDEEEGDITSKIQISGQVNTNVTSRYNLVYSVTDSIGNTTIGTRTVRVIPSKRPSIIGADNVTIKTGEYFNPLKGVIAKDWENKDLTNKIKLTGEVVEEISGKYNLVYSVEDEEGNHIIATRTVIVKSNDKPHIIGVDNIIISTGDNFDPRVGVVATDKEDLDLTSKIEISGEANSAVPGIYNIIYSVIDKDGNKTTVLRNITVRSKNKPVIVGVDDISIKTGDNFDPLLGVMAHDEEDGNLNKSINISGVVNNKIANNYNLVYSVVDSDGNQYSITRRVIVRTNDKPIINGTEDITIKTNEDFNTMLGIMAVDKEDGDLTNNITISGNVNTKVSGEYNLIYTVKDTDGNISAITRKVTVRSNKKPIITGTSDLNININDSFNPMTGVIAHDEEDGDLTSNLKISGYVDNKVNGNYNLVYSVSDKDGNKSVVTRRVTVRTLGKPIIRGVDDITINVNDIFEPMTGIVATDEEDGDLTNNISISGYVNNKVSGKYNLIYSVNDSDGNKSTITRKVVVRSNNKPIIKGVEDITIKEGENFDLMESVIATDAEDGDLTANIKTTGIINNKVAGVYNIVYSVSDKDGNKSTVTRIVTVRINEKPIIRGAENITIKVGDEFNPLSGIVAIDKENGDLTNSIVVTGNINNKVNGNYNLVYSVSDKDGNKSIVTRVVTVRTNKKPIINGIEDISVIKGEVFHEKDGVIAIDEEDGDLTDKISIEGHVDTNINGLYNLIYSVIDNDGNKSIVRRVITVRNNEKPVIRGVEDVTINEGQSFDAMEGIVAFDREDGDLSKEIKIEAHVDNEINGRYNLIYSVIDKDGNKSVANRIITVTTNEKPTIRGAENITIKIGSSFDPKLGVIALDKENNNLTDSLKIIGNINNNIAGEYNIIYSVVDKEGNETIITRVVKVISNDNAVIFGNENIKIKIGEKFDKKQGVIAVDKNNEDLAESIEVEGSVDSENTGIYKLNYLVKDKDNKITREEREVTVVKEDFPIIEGAEKIIIKNSEEFNPMEGIIGKDKKDGNITSLIKVDGKVNNKVNGRYKLIYSIEDKDGNKTIVPREVIVGEDINLIDEVVGEEEKIHKDTLLKNKNANNVKVPMKALVALGAVISAAAISIFKIKKK